MPRRHDPRDDLRQWMDAHDRGPTWVAEQSGWTREMISYVYHKRKKMSRKLARDLQERLGIDIRWTPDQPIVEADEPATAAREG